MIIYHGHPSPNAIESCREAAPEYEHGAEWSPAKMTPHDWPYIIDNGAFSAYVNNQPWGATEFVHRVLEISEKMPREPDFVVLPDVVTDSDATLKRSAVWARLLSRLDVPLALAVQDGMTPGDVTKFIAEHDIDAIFVGGTTEWKRRHAESFGETAEQFDIQFHIGRPGSIPWAEQIGADSVDTTTVVHNQDWARLRRISEQQPLAVSPIDDIDRGFGGSD